jgi:hypothetical protein
MALPRHCPFRACSAIPQLLPSGEGSPPTCATLPVDVETSRYRAQLSALVGLLGSAFALSFSKTDALLDQLLGDAFGGNICADDCLCELSDCFHAYN